VISPNPKTPAGPTDAAAHRWDLAVVHQTYRIGGDVVQTHTRNPARNLAARMGRWSASHRKTAIFGWLAFVIAAIAIGTAVGGKTIDQNNNNTSGPSARADQILKAGGFRQSNPLTEIVVVQSKHLTVAAPAFQAAIADVVRTVAPLHNVHNLRWPSQRANRDQLSRDGRTALVEWEMSGKLKAAEKQIDPLINAVTSVATRHPGFYIGEAGTVSSGKALDKLFKQQIGQAGERSIPLTLLILVLVFGSLLAAWIPLMLGLQAVIATIGLTNIISHLTPMDPNVQAVVMLVGLAVGVDYTLFYLRREREERAAGRSERAALEAAAATSGRSVLISGATVLVAMAGMLFSGDKTFISMSIGTMIVVAVAMIGSLTVLPAVLSKLGDRVEKGRIPWLSRLRRPVGEGRVWSTVLTPVLRRPVVSATLAVAVLATLAIPTLQIHTASSSLTTMPRSAPTVETLDRVQAAFPGQATPAVVAVKADTTSAAFRRAVGELRAAAAATHQGYGAITVESNASHTVGRISIPLPGNGTDGTSTRALLSLRGQLLPATIGKLPAVTYGVTGATAGSYDWNEKMKSSMPLVLGFVLTLGFLLLLASFRSLVIAAKAVVLNLLSVAAAYGVVVAVFQFGWGKNLLGFTSNGSVAPWLPLFMFVILFGLSMDYHVFILSRVREAHDRGMSTEDAVAHGIKTTAGTVTSAALVMVGVFSIFATLPILDVKEMGIGLATAVLLDATIVRGVLLPASMKLLGDWNWYLPNWLRWLPKIEHHAGTAIQPAPVAA
jgi:RND superfamily putative drug exporter